MTVLGDQSHLAETRWLEDRFPRARRTVRTNNRNGMLAAVQAGLGVACLPCFMGDGLSGVVRLTDPADMPPREVWLGVHEDLRHMPRIRAVIEALDEGFAAMQGRLAGLG